MNRKTETAIMNYQQAISTIQEKLGQRAPQRLKIPEFIPSAIILPLFEKNGEAHILLTVRTDTVAHHKGQVSCPGGAWETQDASLEATALRETEEEVGIPAGHITLIGQLDDFPTITNFMVTPYIGTIPYPYQSNINREEVAELLEVPLALFLNDQHFEMKEKTFNGKRYPVYYYYFNHAIIWGVTGFILNRFIELVFDYNPAPKSIRSDPRNEAYLRENIVRKGTQNYKDKG